MNGATTGSRTLKKTCLALATCKHKQRGIPLPRSDVLCRAQHGVAMRERSKLGGGDAFSFALDSPWPRVVVVWRTQAGSRAADRFLDSPARR